jgi:eukaryotic-like serine/threonine-protein kinase
MMLRVIGGRTMRLGVVGAMAVLCALILALSASPALAAPGFGKRQCTVPKLVGKRVAAARRALRRSNCRVGPITRKHSAKVARRRVIASDPKAGTTHKAGTKVALTVSTGGGGPKATQCTVPAVVGKKLGAARRALRRANCRVGPVTRHVSTTVAKGRVISTSPAAGTVNPAGTKVALTVSRGPAYPIPKPASDRLGRVLV